MAAIAEETPGTISLGQGVVHYGPPEAAIAAVRRALAEPSTHEYQHGLGLPQLRERLAAKLLAENRVGAAVRVATDEAYQPRVDALRAAITKRTRAIVTVTPNNPSGAVYGEALLRDLDALCRERGIYHVCDETYEYLTYGSARHFSPGSLPGAEERSISIHSLSKAYGFAGWRIGYVTYPTHLEAAMAKIQDTVLICPTVASQVAAMAALDAGRSYCEPYVRELAEIRAIVLAQLSTLAPRVHVPVADGAFYCFLKVDTSMDPMAIAERLIREYRVAVLPGFTFGMSDGCYFRIAYGALQKDTVTEGIGRLVRGLRAILIK